MRRSKRHRRILTALGTGGASFHSSVVRSARRRGGGEHRNALGLAALTALGFVLEPFVVEKQLFPGGEYEICAAVDAGQYFVLKFH